MSDLDLFTLTVVEAVIAAMTVRANTEEFATHVGKVKDMLRPIADRYWIAEKAFIAGMSEGRFGSPQYDFKHAFEAWWEKTYPTVTS